MTKLLLSDSISQISGIGPRHLKYLEKLGIHTVKDLLWHFPFRYDDFSKIKPISELTVNEKVSIVGTITKINLRRSWHKKMFIVEAKVADDTGIINVIWFNQSFLLKTLPVGTTVSLSGLVKQKGKQLLLSSPTYEIISQQKLEKNFFKDLKHTGRLVPIYPETKGLTSRTLRYFIQFALKNVSNLNETLPNFLLQKNSLLPLRIALTQIHFPQSLEMAQQAKQRFIYESLLLSQLYLLKMKKKMSLAKAPLVELNIPLLQEFVKSLPFQLTQDQKRALWETAQDMSQKPMNRLLEGEVGSGKTIVAIGASLLVYKSKYQVAVMAPTEILAKQHYENFKKFLQNFHCRIVLLTSSNSLIYDDGLEGNISKKVLTKITASSLPIIIIGTHALIQKQIQFNRLGLVIVDEQHRFGVEQRKALLSKSLHIKEEIPHLLSMTATPIPRTLALAFYGDLDLSIIKEMPQGRKKITTKVVLPQTREKIYQFIRSEINKGRQCFVICPRIEITEINAYNQPTNLLTLAEQLNYEVKAVKKEYEKLAEQIFPDLKVAMLHGKMKSPEKTAIMEAFSQGAIDILVSTSVVEVGVDIPNATIMMIEGAEHFGLAQLHQFRGRVGRSSYQSYCFVFTELNSKNALRRLKLLEKYNDGFKLAEFDLSLRGPGEFLGTKQSGIPDLVMNSLLNKEMIETVHSDALRILNQDTTLKKWPSLLTNFQEFSEKASRS
ncbi:MAG: ATP-dependent DNA helicase RecG [Parcubacteria group bacterium ADurb.Bin305]|nr:MAG: ATP-dependent DNA helicase RecG [Parcubacteria group bacterium ADurb.Bin305]